MLNETFSVIFNTVRFDPFTSHLDAFPLILIHFILNSIITFKLYSNLQWDSGENDPDRILIFGSDEYFRRLHLVDHFFSDGIMNNIPIFDQLYSIHGKIVSLFFIFTKKNTECPNKFGMG